jgi:selenocysteine lyase/cysteine desulfurase
VRAQFALDPAWMHFASFFIASHPAPVRDAIEGYRRAIDRNPFVAVEHGMFGPDEENLPLRVRREVAAYIGARPEEVALTGNTTTGLALVYQGLRLRPGDEILVTEHDHYSHHESVRLAAARNGARVRRVRLFDDAATATTAQMIAALRAAITPRTRVVGLTWVHSSTGIRLPVREIAAAIKPGGAGPMLVLDGVHGLGAVDADIPALGCDFFCAGTHKWMFAPRGTGIVWARADDWARLDPVVPSFSDFEQYTAWEDGRAPATPTNADRVSPGGFHAYEHQWAMASAFAMHRAMGRTRVADRIRSLNDRLKAGLARNARVRMHTPRSGELSAGLVAFEVDGIKPADVVRRLGEKRIIASTSPYKVSYARLAPSLVNTEDEVDRAIAAVAALSA